MEFGQEMPRSIFEEVLIYCKEVVTFSPGQFYKNQSPKLLSLTEIKSVRSLLQNKQK